MGRTVATGCNEVLPSGAASSHYQILATGADSRVELPNVELITGGGSYNDRIYITAEDGGVIDLSRVDQIADAVDGDIRYRSIEARADGVGSRIEFDQLTSISDHYGSDFGEALYSAVIGAMEARSIRRASPTYEVSI